MSKPYSFRRIYYLTITAVLFLATGVIGTFWIVSEYTHHVEALESLQTEVKGLINDLVESIEYQKKNAEEKLKINLAHQTETAWSIANAIYQKHKDRLTEKEIKQLIITALMPIRFFDGRGY